ncbi:hypothetical protein AOC36_10735 [Erysipelothrix larvae]|uniref:DUF2179 domain-containing protein n=1 Tax=Erysipelothrix larvae TaxID=1514105 RepID=A0A0X8H1R5_9FIRM|nr:YitT family protein [Erysipelothrix larvae]AMC94430.1 hypothetical protein AOC36_10735 [Erysipelothrix larvae]
MKLQLKNCLYMMAGGALFSLTVNLFLTPLQLYNGGITGISQLLRDLVVNVFHINPGFDLTGVFNLLLNIPIFIFAYTRLSKNFVGYSIITVVSQAITMIVVPIPSKPLINDVFVTILLAAVIGAFGSSLSFKGRGSGGGLDILGIYQSQKKGATVGKLYLVVNSLIYFICFIFYNFEIAVYSLVYSFIFAQFLDRFHHHNLEVSVMVFTKNKDIKYLVNSKIRRGATYWDGAGAFTNTPIEIFVTIVAQSEVDELKKMIHGMDPNAFIAITENLKVSGGFEKRLI